MQIEPVANNVTKLILGDRYFIFSYKTPVIYYDGETLYVTDKKWSNTTSRHINQFLKNNFTQLLGKNTVAVKQDTIDSSWKATFNSSWNDATVKISEYQTTRSYR